LYSAEADACCGVALAKLIGAAQLKQSTVPIIKIKAITSADFVKIRP